MSAGRKKILVLGAGGMLGSMAADYLSRDETLSVTATVRDDAALSLLKTKIDGIDWKQFSITTEDQTKASLQQLGRFDWIVNAIGIIKPYARDDRLDERRNAIAVNAFFPYWLVEYADETQSQILQIATDCVYSGTKGHYLETDPHDPLDVYGKTKSLGEVPAHAIRHLRCSIIGPETKSYRSLLEWFLHQPQNAALNGFTNHQWNGVTTLHYAKICQGIIHRDISLPLLQHVVPACEISKYNLLLAFAESYHRKDLTIHAVEAATIIDRTLATTNAELNQSLWAAAGYPDSPPTIEKMVRETAAYDYRLSGCLES